MLRVVGALVSERSFPKYYDIFGIPSEIIFFAFGIFTLVIAFLSFKASRRANELKTVPKLILKYVTSGTNNGKITLYNLDKEKLAYNIEILPLYLINKRDGGVYKVQFKQDGENYIFGSSSGEIVLEEEVLRNGAVESSKSFSTIYPNIRTEKRPLIIKFYDSQAIQYFTIVHFDKGKERIIRTPTKFTLRWRLYVGLLQYIRAQRAAKYLKRAYKRKYPNVR